MSAQLRFGFIGAGEIAVASAEAIRGAQASALARVFDPQAALAAQLAATYGGRPAETIDALLADPDVDAVYICTPHMVHRELAERAAAAGKHLFIEKPLGVSPSDAAAIVAACRRHGVACGVPFVVRYAPAYSEARRLVQSGAIGRVTGFRITYRGDKPASYWSGGYSGRAQGDWRQGWATAGGGVLIMNTIHDLDALLWITGLAVEQAQGVFQNSGSPGEVEDVGLAILSCAGGALGSIEALAALPGGAGPTRLWVNRIYGGAGQIVLPSPWGADPLLYYTRAEGAWREIAFEEAEEARRLAFADYASALLAGRPAPIPGEAGLMAATVIHAIYESGRRGGAPVRAG